jgi:hypothetical protein
MNDKYSQSDQRFRSRRETIPATADASSPAAAEEVRADVAAEAERPVDDAEQLGAAADPAPADQVEAPRNPRSDAEGAHAELHPETPAAVESKPMLPCPHEELSVDHLGKVTCDDCGTELALKKKDLNPHLAAPPSAEPAPIVKAAPARRHWRQPRHDKLDSAGNVKGAFPARKKDPVEEPMHMVPVRAERMLRTSHSRTKRSACASDWRISARSAECRTPTRWTRSAMRSTYSSTSRRAMTNTARGSRTRTLAR